MALDTGISKGLAYSYVLYSSLCIKEYLKLILTITCTKRTVSFKLKEFDKLISFESVRH